MVIRRMYALWFEEGYLCHVNGEVLATDDVNQASLLSTKEEARDEGKTALKDGFVIVPIDVTIIKEPTNGVRLNPRSLYNSFIETLNEEP